MRLLGSAKQRKERRALAFAPRRRPSARTRPRRTPPPRPPSAPRSGSWRAAARRARVASAWRSARTQCHRQGCASGGGAAPVGSAGQPRLRTSFSGTPAGSRDARTAGGPRRVRLGARSAAVAACRCVCSSACGGAATQTQHATMRGSARCACACGAAGRSAVTRRSGGAAPHDTASPWRAAMRAPRAAAAGVAQCTQAEEGGKSNGNWLRHSAPRHQAGIARVTSSRVKTVQASRITFAFSACAAAPRRGAPRPRAPPCPPRLGSRAGWRPRPALRRGR